MEIWVIITATLVLLIMLWGLMRATQDDPSSPDEVVQEAEIYRAYGRDKDALALIHSALEQHPQHPQLLRLREELQKE